MISTLNGLEKLHLYLDSNAESLNFSSFTNLKELGLSNYHTKFQIDFESSAKSLANLERIYFSCVEPKLIEPFIQHSAKLKGIKIMELQGEKIIDMSEWNEKREKLAGARKLNIYLKEEEFLVTKWNNKRTDFKMFELKRAESHNW